MESLGDVAEPFATEPIRVSASPVRDLEHSKGAPTIEATVIWVFDMAKTYEHSGYSPDEIVDLYPAFTLLNVHTALAFYYEHVDEFRSPSATSAAV